ncbi:unnamed protein product [Linum trigynum]|uniref:Gnk2-homologous domain-containing protein n=1 Tax=Linum trigynum TaxID=586398 RepID=A0AAV2CLD6_9ROSI
MGVQVRRLDARMTTVLMSLLIVTMINGGFRGGAIIFSAEAALDPLCGVSNEWFCSPTDFDRSDAQEQVLPYLRVRPKCDPAYYNHGAQIAYIHSSCAHSSTCGDCLTRATQIMRENCPGKDGAQYGTEECCARYEKNKFC